MTFLTIALCLFTRKFYTSKGKAYLDNDFRRSLESEPEHEYIAQTQLSSAITWQKNYSDGLQWLNHQQHILN